MKKKDIIIILGVLIILFLGIYFYNFTNSKIHNFKTVKDKNVLKEDNHAKLTLVGDFLFEDLYYQSIASGDNLNTYFQKVKPYFANDDLSIGNMEVVIGNENLKVSGSGYNFCAPSYIGNLVASLDLEVLSTANNHTYDRGMAGIKSTIDYFKNNTDIITVGTNIDGNSSKILTINNIKFGFLAYTYGTNQKISDNEKDYISMYKDPDTLTFTNEYQEKIKKEVSALRREVDVLVVILHWGREFTYEENTEQINLANFLNSLDVDLIVGSHSHSIEPIKWVGDNHKTLIYYSLGNFTSSDDDISRTGEEFDNAYQFGILSTLEVNKKDNNITFNNIKTIPIINFYDENMRNFELIPLDEYDYDYEHKHYRYQFNFNKDFVVKTYEKVISEEFR